MSDDYIDKDEDEDDDEDQFIEDPRITDLVREAPTMTEVILNAEFLLDEYVTEYLKGASGFVWGIFIDHGAGINRADNPTKAGRLSVTDEVWD